MRKQIEQTLDSREVAEMVEKEHHKLLRDIRTYIEQLTESKIGFSQTVDKVPAKAGLFYIYNRFSGIMELSERRCFL